MKKNSGKQIAIILLALFGVLAVLALVAGAVYFLLRGGGGENRMLIAVPDRDNESDLLLVEFGRPEDEPVELGRNVQPASVLYLVPWEDGHFDVFGNFFSSFGGFVPGTDFLLYWYLDDDEIYINTSPLNGGEPVTLLDSKASFLIGMIFRDSRTVFIEESVDDKVRCYISQANAEADRVGKGTDCTLSWNGSKLLLKDDSDGVTTLTVMDPNGENEVTLLDEEENINSVDISYDGSQVTYVQEIDGNVKVFLVESTSGDVIAESGEYYGIVNIGFPSRGNNLFFIAENEEGELQLFTLDAQGEQEIAGGLTMNAEFNATGSQLVYMIGDEDDERTVYVHSLSADTDVEVAKGMGLQFSLLASPERILVRQIDEDELTIYSSSMDGQNVLELYNEVDSVLAETYQVPGENQLYLLLNNADGTSLFTTPLDQENGFVVLDEWAYIGLLNRAPEGGQILFSGIEDEGDAPVLYLLPLMEDASPIELDDDTEGVRNAIFTPDGKNVVYTVETGSDADEVEVRQVAMDGESKYEALYEESYLVDAQWGMLRPFDFSQSWTDAKGSTSFCPGAPTLTDEVQAEWKSGEESCYRVRLEADQAYSISVDSGMDTSLTLYDREGNTITSDDDSGSGSNPLIFTSVDTTGTYYIMVTVLTSQSSGRFTLNAVQGYGDPALDNPTMLTFNQRTRGVIASSSRLDIENLDYSNYGELYAFQGESGQSVTIDVFAPSIDSKLDPRVFLISSSLEVLGSDDDSGEGYDAQLTVTLPADGLYFVLVDSLGGLYGSSNDYFYEVLLTNR